MPRRKRRKGGCEVKSPGGCSAAPTPKNTNRNPFELLATLDQEDDPQQEKSQKDEVYVPPNLRPGAKYVPPYWRQQELLPSSGSRDTRPAATSSGYTRRPGSKSGQGLPDRMFRHKRTSYGFECHAPEGESWRSETTTPAKV